MLELAPLLVLAFVVATAADIHSTARALAKGYEEGNPVIDLFIDTFGGLWWFGKTALATGAILLLVNSGALGLVILTAGTILTAWVAARNYRIAG